MTTRLRSAIDSATTLLADAGIDSARYDAEELAAHVAGTERGRLSLLGPPDDTFFDHYNAAVAARSRRVPLQHLTGTAAFGPLTLSVGPGVFIPRPETEAMLEWAVAQTLPAKPVVVDVCTGSGALALALARHWPGARVIGLDDSDAALDYARRNAAGTTVEFVRADVTHSGVLTELEGQRRSRGVQPALRSGWRRARTRSDRPRSATRRVRGPGWHGGDSGRRPARGTLVAPRWPVRCRARRHHVLDDC